MWCRFSLYDVRVIGHYLGTLILFAGILMAVPFATALVFQEWEPAARYFFSIGIAVVAGALLRFLRIEPSRLDRQQALAVTGLAWVVLAVFCSIPLYFSGHYATYLDALFDGVSGLTTTGASLVQDLDHLSNADNMLRFMMHLLGGLGLIVVALSFGLFGKRAGSSLYTSEGRNEHVVPNVVQTAQFIARITAVVIITSTVVIALVCLVAGMEPVRAGLHAFWISISAFVTGGFTPMAQSILYYHSFPLEIILMVLMILGSISFVIHAEVWKGRVGIIFKSIVSTIKEALSPDSARVVVAYNHVGRRILSPEIAKEAMTVFILYVVTYVIGALVGIAHGYDATQAIFESVAMTSNGGIITGLATPGMPVTLEVFYIFQMWVGRLEFVTLLALIVEVVVSVIPRRKPRS